VFGGFKKIVVRVFIEGLSFFVNMERNRYKSKIIYLEVKYVYKITYSNGKIYIGKDLTGSIRYFGSPNNLLLEKEFTDEQKKDFTIRREILWQSEDATDKEVNKKEVEFILALKSNDSKIGYNLWPKLKIT